LGTGWLRIVSKVVRPPNFGNGHHYTATRSIGLRGAHSVE